MLQVRGAGRQIANHRVLAQRVVVGGQVRRLYGVREQIVLRMMEGGEIVGRLQCGSHLVEVGLMICLMVAFRR